MESWQPPACTGAVMGAFVSCPPGSTLCSLLSSLAQNRNLFLAKLIPVWLQGF